MILLDNSVRGDRRGTEFEVTLCLTLDVGPIPGFAGGGISYCIRDPRQGIWCTYVAAYGSIEFDFMPADASYAPNERERWVPFRACRRARVHEFDGEILLLSAGYADPLDVSIGPMWFCHRLFPPATPPEEFRPAEGQALIHNGLMLPTGGGLQLGAAASVGYATPSRSGWDNDPPWLGYEAGISR